jgi:biopolymer transport protein ExbB
VNLLNYVDNFSALFEQGGLTLWAILFASILLWLLIVERYWFHWRQLPALKLELRQELARYQGKQQSHQLLIRQVQDAVGHLSAEAGRNLQALQALTGILPLLGLLGTVSGMIKVFDVITVFGTGNTRGMASGISEALVTTMAGLFTALSGIYFVSNLEGRREDESRQFEAELMEEL